MNDHLNLIHSEARARELQREAQQWRLGQGSNGNGRAEALRVPSPLVIRIAQADDSPALNRLAELDGHPSPGASSLLVAELEGEVLAALPLAGGKPIADPFRPTAQLVEMLKLRAGQLRDCGSARRGLREKISRLFRIRTRRPAMAPATPGNARMLIPRD